MDLEDYNNFVNCEQLFKQDIRGQALMDVVGIGVGVNPSAVIIVSRIALRVLETSRKQAALLRRVSE